jgi:hypothetical protein
MHGTNCLTHNRRQNSHVNIFSIKPHDVRTSNKPGHDAGQSQWAIAATTIACCIVCSLTTKTTDKRSRSYECGLNFRIWIRQPTWNDLFDVISIGLRYDEFVGLAVLSIVSQIWRTHQTAEKKTTNTYSVDGTQCSRINLLATISAICKPMTHKKPISK